MIKYFLYSAIGLLFSLTISHSLTLQDIHEKLTHNYEEALKTLPATQKKQLEHSQSLWQQYRDEFCDIHQKMYQGNGLQCRIKLTFYHYAYMRLLLPDQSALIQFIQHSIKTEVNNFQAIHPQNSGHTFSENAEAQLQKSLQSLIKNYPQKDVTPLRKAFATWQNYRNEMCELLNERHIISTEYCLAKFSLDMDHELRHHMQ